MAEDTWQDFFNFQTGRRNPPWPIFGDAYTAAGQAIASPAARRRSVYNLTCRRPPPEAWPGLARDNRMVLYGVADFVRTCLTEPLDVADVDLAGDFMATAHAFGGPLNFDETTWLDALREFGGNLPVKIEALPEGSTFWPNEPVLQVTSLGDGYGEMAAIIEATLLGMVACATARATATRHLLERMRREVRLNHPDAAPVGVDSIARFMVHDFGMRASSTPLEAEIFGRAHLLSFHGTDTFNAAFSAWASAEAAEDFRPGGTSILAHAHRIILGYDTEGEAVRALADAADGCGGMPIASYLADTYGYRNFVDKLAVPLALEFKRRGGGVVVVRPDSGDAIENIAYLLGRAGDAGLFGFDPGGRTVATHLRFIHGDSVDPGKIDAVFAKLRDLGANSVRWGIFGIGGWLRRQGDRDLLSAAYKLAAKGPDDTPVVKLSETLAKVSVPGPTDLVRFPPHDLDGRPTVYLKGSHPYRCRYVPYYDGSQAGDAAIRPACYTPFPEVRRHSIAEFDGYAAIRPDRGSAANPVLDAAILALQRDTMGRHGRESGVAAAT